RLASGRGHAGEDVGGGVEVVREGRAGEKVCVALLGLLGAADPPADVVPHQDLRAQPAIAGADLRGELGGIGVDELVAGTGFHRRLVGKTAEAIIVVPPTQVPVEAASNVVVALNVRVPGLGGRLTSRGAVQAIGAEEQLPV